MQRFDRTQELIIVKPMKFAGRPLQAGFRFHLKTAHFQITPAKARALFESGFIRHPDPTTEELDPYIVAVPSLQEQFHLAEIPFTKLKTLTRDLGLRPNNNKQDMLRQVCLHLGLAYPVPGNDDEQDSGADSQSDPTTSEADENTGAE